LAGIRVQCVALFMILVRLCVTFFVSFRRTYICCPSPRVPESASCNLKLKMRMSECSLSSMTSTSYSQARTRIPSSSSKSNARRTSTHPLGRSSVTNVSLNNRAEPARTVVNGGRRTRSLFCLAPAMLLAPQGQHDLPLIGGSRRI